MFVEVTKPMELYKPIVAILYGDYKLLTVYSQSLSRILLHDIIECGMIILRMRSEGCAGYNNHSYEYT